MEMPIKETHRRIESDSYDVMMTFSAVIRSWSGRKALFPTNAGMVEV